MRKHFRYKKEIIFIETVSMEIYRGLKWFRAFGELPIVQ